jgi:hypothetical protein
MIEKRFGPGTQTWPVMLLKARGQLEPSKVGNKK